MRIIASTDTDDFDKKSFLFLTNEGGNLFLSLEVPEVIVDSEYCNEYDTKNTVNDFLVKLDKLYPITVCYITKRIDKYLKNLSKYNHSYIYDFGPREEFDGQEGYIYAIRSPGSTKGCIYIDKDNIITDFKIYDDSLNHFKEGVKDLEQEFIGYELDKTIGYEIIK